MKKTLLVIIVLVLIGLGGWLVLGHKDNKPNNDITSQTTNTGTNSQTSTPTPTQKTTKTTTNATTAIEISNFSFQPDKITVKKGTTVTWTNKDSANHTVTGDDSQNGPASNTLAPGDSYSFTFTKTGTFTYHCSFHTDMTGSVTVTQ